MALKRNQIPAPLLPKEAVHCEPLGGEVIVRALRLSERIALFSDLERGGGAADAEEGSAVRSFSPEAYIPRLLASTVMAEDGLPVYSEAEWEDFGARHGEAALDLFMVAQRLSGLGKDAVEAAKKK